MRDYEKKKKILSNIFFITIFLTFHVKNLNASGNFLTRDEYAKMLYVEPRGGISCESCHGVFGNGKVIDKHWDRKSKKYVEIKTSPLSNLSPAKFKKSMSKKIKLMPRYYFTKLELNALYYFIFKSSEKYVKYLKDKEQKKISQSEIKQQENNKK